MIQVTCTPFLSFPALLLFSHPLPPGSHVTYAGHVLLWPVMDALELQIPLPSLQP